MRFLLHAFSANLLEFLKNTRLGDICLAYAFTYRDLDDFQGIAWIKVSRPIRVYIGLSTFKLANSFD